MAGLAAFLLLAQAAPPSSKPEAIQAVRTWLSTADESARAALPQPWKSVPPLSKAEAEEWTRELWKVYKEETLQQLAKTPRELAGGAVRTCVVRARGHEMKYTLEARGKRPASGWPVYLMLHGGGNAGPKVNDEQWLAAQKWHQPKIKDALYVCPRAIVDTEMVPWLNQDTYALVYQLLRELKLYDDVDTNRVYVMGFSVGGWAAFRFGALLTDCWGGVAASAGGSQPAHSPPRNFRHTPFLIQVGELDTEFDRAALSRQFAGILETWASKEPGFFVHRFVEHQGKGHQIDDRDAPAWLARHARTPRPKKLSWFQPLHFSPWFFWLRFGQPAHAGSVVTAEAKGNILALETNLAAQPLTLMLDDRLVDLDQPVTVTLNGATLVQQKCERKVETLLQTLLERGDPELVYSSWVQARPSK